MTNAICNLLTTENKNGTVCSTGKRHFVIESYNEKYMGQKLVHSDAALFQLGESRQSFKEGNWPKAYARQLPSLKSMKGKILNFFHENDFDNVYTRTPCNKHQRRSKHRPSLF